MDMDIIPQDLWPIITSFMDDKTKRQMRLANTKWFNAIKYNNFRLYFTRKEDVATITDRLSKYSWPIKVEFKKPKIDDALDVIQHLSSLTNLTELYDDEQVEWQNSISQDQWMHLSTLTNIEVWSFLNSGPVPMSLPLFGVTVPTELLFKFPKLTHWQDSKEAVKYLTNLNSLHLDSDQSYERNSESNKATWIVALLANPEKLTQLHVGASINQADGYEVLSRLTNLKELHLSNNCNDITDLSQLKALEYCDLSGRFIPSLRANTNLTKLRIWIPAGCSIDTNQLTTLTKLHSLEMIVFPNDEPVQFNFLSHLIQLRNFRLDNRSDYNNTSTHIPSSIYQCLSPTLKVLKTSGDISLDLAMITHLTNLEELNNPRHIQYLSVFTKLKVLHGFYSHEDQDWRALGKLTKLEQLVFSSNSFSGSISDYKLPEISGLVKLRNMSWTSDSLPNQLMHGLQFLTDLQSLNIHSRHRDEKPLVHWEVFSELTNLTNLSLWIKTDYDEDFWRNLAPLTNIQSLKIFPTSIGGNDGILTMTAFRNLTELFIENEPGDDFDGRHFTALTSLQLISFYGIGNRLIHKKETLLKTMPHLLWYNYMDI